MALLGFLINCSTMIWVIPDSLEDMSNAATRILMFWVRKYSDSV